MKSKILFILLVVASLISNAQILDGKWKGNMMSPNGDFELVFTFNIISDSLCGDVTSSMGTLPIENGKVNGNEFSFDVNVNGQIINHIGLIDNNIVKLNIPMMNDPMILVQVEDKSKVQGVWLSKTTGPQGDMELTFTFEINDKILKGKNSSIMGETEITNGVINGNEFSFDVDLQGMIISHKCFYLDDDTIDMKALVMGQEMALKLTRKGQ